MLCVLDDSLSANEADEAPCTLQSMDACSDWLGATGLAYTFFPLYLVPNFAACLDHTYSCQGICRRLKNVGC